MWPDGMNATFLLNHEIEDSTSSISFSQNKSKHNNGEYDQRIKKNVYILEGTKPLSFTLDNAAHCTVM